MNQKLWLDEIKKDLEETVYTLNWGNLDDVSKKMTAYAKLLEGMAALQGIGNTTEVFFADEQEIKDTKDNLRQIYVGEFRRELVGGRIGSADIFVPESIVRKLSIEQGDWVRAKGVKSILMKNGAMRTLYDYVPLQKAEEAKDTGRIQIDFQRVRYDEDKKAFYIDPKTADFNDKPIVITEKDRRNLYLEEDDLVDYAYYKEAPYEGRVVWKHKRDQE